MQKYLSNNTTENTVVILTGLQEGSDGQDDEEAGVAVNP